MALNGTLYQNRYPGFFTFSFFVFDFVKVYCTRNSFHL